MSTIIHCSLWGDIEVSDMALRIIDTPHFQRLHYIRQTGFAYKVFPSATTSRFEHSIGVYHTTRLFMDRFRLVQPEVVPDKRTQELVCIAGLVHDLGHGPFSHLFDSLLETILPTHHPWIHHEHRGMDVLVDLVTYLEHKEGISILTHQEIEMIRRWICGPPRESDAWYERLVWNHSSGLDTDKIDYILRDGLHFGIMGTRFDFHRILKNTRVLQNKLSFCNRVRDEIRLLFDIRERMHKTIYRHPKIQYFEDHLLSLLSSTTDVCEDIKTMCLQKNIVSYLRLNDSSILSRVSHHKWDDVETRRAPPLLCDHPPYHNRQTWENAEQHLSFYQRSEIRQEEELKT